MFSRGGGLSLVPMSPGRTIKDLPGPRGLPLIGNAHQIRSHDAHLRFEEWSRLYGPVFRFDLGPRHWVGISDGEEIHRLLRERPDGFRRPREIKSISDETDTTGLFAEEGEGWHRSRRLVVSAFNANRLQSYFHVIARASRRLQADLARVADGRTGIEISRQLRCFTVDITSELAFGHDLNTLENGDHELQTHIQLILEVNGRRSLRPFPYWRWIRLPADRAIDRSLAVVHEAVDGFIAAARRRMAERPELLEEPENLLEGMLAAQRAEGTFTDEEIAGNVITLLVAGEDTTAFTTAWTLWFLARNRDLQERCAIEALGALSAKGELDTPDSFERLDLTEATLREAMRLKPVAPVITLETIGEAAIAGATIPAGTALMLATRASALAAVERGGEFDPERWLGSKDDPARPDQRAFLAFGAGPRFCPGRNLAFLLAKAALATILSGFSFELDPSADPVTEFLNFTVVPKDLRLLLSERQA
jgi:cytochrome P450